jgi:hypothetical protein
MFLKPGYYLQLSCTISGVFSSGGKKVGAKLIGILKSMASWN